jgi:anthranilate synthase component 2
MKILLLDNHDSFTYNLLHLTRALGYRDVEVHRGENITLERVDDFDKIILSPGPGLPAEAPLLLPLIRRHATTKSILGVCLGHQAIAEAFGGTLLNLRDVYHGVATPVNVIAPHHLFAGLPPRFEAGRYHSWVVNPDTLPDTLQVTAIDDHGHVMAIKHRQLDLHGLQFHPESVLTPAGKEIMKRFLIA